MLGNTGCAPPTPPSQPNFVGRRNARASSNTRTPGNNSTRSFAFLRRPATLKRADRTHKRADSAQHSRRRQIKMPKSNTPPTEFRPRPLGPSTSPAAASETAAARASSAGNARGRSTLALRTRNTLGDRSKHPGDQPPGVLRINRVRRARVPRHGRHQRRSRQRQNHRQCHQTNRQTQPDPVGLARVAPGIRHHRRSIAHHSPTPHLPPHSPAPHQQPTRHHQHHSV